MTGAASIQRELDPIFNEDLKKGESIAIPIALLVLLLVFGLSASVTIPFIFAACTITGTLGIMYGVVHLAETPTYVTNLVQLIGLGIAVDYWLLIVYRFREELALTGTRTRRSCARWRPPAARSSSPASRSRSGSRCSSRCRCRSCG